MKNIKMPYELEPFELMPDFREGYRVKHQLHEIIFCAFCATIAGANDWHEVEAFCIGWISWLKKFVELKNGTPSHDTFSRVFSRIERKYFEKAFVTFADRIGGQLKQIGDDLAIDGKTMRRSYNDSLKKSALHVVSVWSSKRNMVMGPQAETVKGKSWNRSKR